MKENHEKIISTPMDMTANVYENDVLGEISQSSIVHYQTSVAYIIFVVCPQHHLWCLHHIYS